MSRPLISAPALALCLLLPAVPAAAEVTVDWSAVGQAAGSYTGKAPAGGDRWNGFAGYALTGRADGMTASGIGYGLVGTLGSGDYEKSLDRPGNREKATLNEVYVWLDTAYGQVRAGDEDGAAKRAVDLLPLLAGGQVDGFWTRAAAVAPPADHLGRDSDDAAKVLYETPRLFGLRLGVSYAPERKSLVEDITGLDAVPTEDDLWEVGLNWRTDSGPWSYELAAGYVRGAAGAAGAADTESRKLAALVLYGGFAAGAVWFDEEVGDRTLGRVDRQGWTVQGTYENGPYGLALWVSDIEAERLLDHTAYGLGLSWRARPELTLGLDLVRYDADRPGASGRSGTVAQLSGEVRF